MSEHVEQPIGKLREDVLMAAGEWCKTVMSAESNGPHREEDLAALPRVLELFLAESK